MSEFTIAQAARFQGQQVTLRGWLYNLRESGKLLFPQFRDGTGIMQAVVSKADVSPEVWERAATLTQESSVIAHGTVRADKRAPGGYELVLNDLTVVQRVPTDQPYPISPKEHGVDFLMSQRHLWMRSAKQSALLRLRHEVIAAIRDFFDSNGFILTDAPILTPAACEGTTTLFELDYFDLGPAYLTQSGQLYIEATAAALHVDGAYRELFVRDADLSAVGFFDLVAVPGLAPLRAVIDRPAVVDVGEAERLRWSRSPVTWTPRTKSVPSPSASQATWPTRAIRIMLKAT